MSDGRQSASLSDSSAATQIDRELAQLRSIVPSAEFVPRVQERIHKDAAFRPSGMPWWIRVGATATIVVALLVGSRVWWIRAPREVGAVLVTKRPSSIATQAAAPVPQPQRVARHSPGRIRSVPAGPSDGRSSQAAVLVSRDQLRAIARLQELVAQGHLTDKNSPLIGSAPGAVTDINPTPLTIPPLTVSSVEIVTVGAESNAGVKR